MNTIYLYHDNFISLLCLIDYLLKNKIKPDNIKDTSYNATLLDEVIFLKIKEDSNIINKIKKNYSYRIFKIMYEVYLSNHDNKELIIYYFFLNTLKYHQDVIYHRNFRCVNLALKIAKQVGNEAHKLKGFLRFKELKNHILYAEIAPDSNVIYLLALHFKRRLPHEYFIIKDKKRNIYSLYDKKEVYLISEDNFNLNEVETSQEEKQIADLWKNFYQTIGIKERKNERCRMNFMPKKYWQYIIEMEDEL